MITESRTALITGASSGLGAAIALEMASRGWKLAIGARRADRLAETAEKVRAQGAAAVYAGDLDVADDASVERFFEASETAIGVADVIVNNAGVSRFHWLAEIDTRWLRSEIETNLIGPMVVTHPGLAPLLAAGTEADVVMVSSDAVRRPRPGRAGLRRLEGGPRELLGGAGPGARGHRHTRHQAAALRPRAQRVRPGLGSVARDDAEADGALGLFRPARRAHVGPGQPGNPDAGRRSACGRSRRDAATSCASRHDRAPALRAAAHWQRLQMTEIYYDPYDFENRRQSASSLAGCAHDYARRCIRF